MTNNRADILETLEKVHAASKTMPILRYGVVALSLYLLISAVNLLSDALAFTQVPDSFLTALENPFVSIAVGMIITILLQSSSASTAVIIALAASESLDITYAIFMVMGANIGTTVTNSAVSIGYIRDKTMFNRTFSAGTVHDFFNLIAVVVFGVLEHFTSLLSTTATWLATLLYGNGVQNAFTTSFLKFSEWVSSFFKLLPSMLSHFNVPSLLLIICAIAMILGSIALLTKTLRTVQEHTQQHAESDAGMLHVPERSAAGQLRAIASGAVTTAIVQSSSVTTSAAVVGVGSQRYTVHDIYPFIAGANVGTTLTALLVALSTASKIGLAVALSHFLFNVVAVIVIFSLPFLRKLPIVLSQSIHTLVEKSRLYAGAYIGVFILVPLLVVFCS